MKNYLITGIAGTGKSAVGEILAQKGYRILETDRASGNVLVYRYRYDVRTGGLSDFERGDGWQKLQHVRWNIKTAVLKDALKGPDGDVQFVCGYANNWNELASEFDGIFLLEASPGAIKDRLLTRTTGDWGRKYPEELKHALETAHEYNESIRALGATVLDAERPLPEVASTIIRTIEARS